MSETRYKRTLLAGLVAVLVVAAGAWAQSRKQSVGLCDSSEKTFFSCRTARGKWITVCGASTNSSRIQYRFGTSKSVELRYPRDNGEAPLRYAHFARAGVERLEVSFDTLGAHYSVFDYT